MALRAHLHDCDPKDRCHAWEHHLEERAKYLEPDEHERVYASRNIPDAVLRIMSEHVASMYDEGLVDIHGVLALSEELRKFTEVQANLEKLLLTPLPLPYTLLVSRSIWLYVIFSPFALASALGWYTPLFNAVIAYVFFGLEEVARQMEAPFRTQAQCLPINWLCRNIEISINEALNEDSPPPIHINEQWVLS